MITPMNKDTIYRTAATLIAAFGVFTVFYLLGAFAANSFDIGTWSLMGRTMVAAFGGLAGVVGGFIVVIEMKFNKKNTP